MCKYLHKILRETLVMIMPVTAKQPVNRKQYSKFQF